jgi:hypothetical protein
MICSKCKQEKTNKDFFKDRSRKSGYRYWCKECCEKFYFKARRKTPQQQEISKKSSLNYYYNNKKICQKKHNEWIKNNAEKNKELQKNWRQNNKEYCRVKYNDWVKENPEKHSAICKRRRARLCGAEGSHTAEDWKKLVIKCGYKCQICMKKEPFKQFNKRLTEDHIIPLSLGGSNYIDNIQPLCHSCNSRKSNIKLK